MGHIPSPEQITHTCTVPMENLWWYRPEHPPTYARELHLRTYLPSYLPTYTCSHCYANVR